MNCCTRDVPHAVAHLTPHLQPWVPALPITGMILSKVLIDSKSYFLARNMESSQSSSCQCHQDQMRLRTELSQSAWHRNNHLRVLAFISLVVMSTNTSTLENHVRDLRLPGCAWFGKVRRLPFLHGKLTYTSLLPTCKILLWILGLDDIVLVATLHVSGVCSGLYSSYCFWMFFHSTSIYRTPTLPRALCWELWGQRENKI